MSTLIEDKFAMLDADIKDILGDSIDGNNEYTHKKVLSIDFDIIMYPCIKLYSDFSAGDLNPTEMWDFVNKMREVEDKLSYDNNTYLNILNLVLSQLKNNAYIYEHLLYSSQ